jgi:hypothetical protein
MFSMVIPTFTMTEDHEKLTLRAIKSYRNAVDELIVCENGGRFSPQVMALADVYLYSHQNMGFTKNVNRGWKLSTGDYCAIVNNDTYLYEGDLHDLLIPDRVTSPEIMNQSIPFLAGPFWVTPKKIRDERGLLMEEMRNYCSDSEYDNRVRDVFQKIGTVKIFHAISQTVRLSGEIDKSGEDEAIYKALKDAGLAK